MNNNITAIGEILWDVYPDQKRLGGAPFNFIYHIWKILGKSNFISSVGNDKNGNEMISFLSSIGFNTSSININNAYPTGTVQVTLDEMKSPKFKISSECSFDHLVLNEHAKEIFENETDLLYFGTFTTRKTTSCTTLLSLLNNTGKKYFCDLNLRHDFYTKEFIEKTLHVCNIIKINQTEFEKLKQLFSLENSNDLAAVQLLNKFRIEMIGLTLGENGAVLYNKSESYRYKPESINVLDTLGAGDAYSAILCLGYLRGWTIEKINKLATRFAGEICTVNGAIPVDDSIYVYYKKAFQKN